MARTPRRVAPYVGLAAEPDAPNIARVLLLQRVIGGELNGRTGRPMQYDRGDPTRSLTGAIKAAPPVATAIGNVAGGGAIRTPSTFQDSAVQNPDLDPYNAILLARMEAKQ